MLLKIEDIELRLLEEGDNEEVVRVVQENRDHLIEYLDFIPNVNLTSQLQAIQKWRQIYRDGEGFEAGIFWRGQFIGMCGLRIDASDDRGEIGYWLAEEYTGKGIMTLLVKELLALGFQSYHLHKITIMTVDTNIKSQGIPKRLGFKYDGLLRDHQKLHGEYRDLYIFSILEKEWRLFYGEEGEERG